MNGESSRPEEGAGTRPTCVRFIACLRPHNNIVARADNYIVDRSIDLRRVEAGMHKHVSQVSIKELPRGGSRFAMPGRLERSGNAAVIYRPNSQGPAPRSPFLPSSGIPRTYARQRFSARPAFPSNPGTRSSSQLYGPHYQSLVLGRSSWFTKSIHSSPRGRDFGQSRRFSGHSAVAPPSLNRRARLFGGSRNFGLRGGGLVMNRRGGVRSSRRR